MKFPRMFRREEKANPVGTSLIVGGTAGFIRWIDKRAFVEEGYQRNPVIYAVVEEVAKAVAGLKFELKRGEDYIEDHPVLDLLRRPNPMQGGRQFIKAIFVDYLTQGEQAIAQPQGQKQPVELWRVDPSEVEVKPGKGGIPAAYAHKRAGIETVFPVRGVVAPRADMFFYKRYNPRDYWRGQSPLMAGGIAGDIHNRGAEWNYSLLKNAAKPSGLVSFKDDPSAETVSKLKEWFKRAFQGSENAGEMPVLTGGADWKQTSLSPIDMDFQSSMTEAKKMIASVYGVPLPLIDNEAATFANMDTAKERFYTDTVLPLANEWLEAFGNWLLPAFGDDLELCVDMDDIPALDAVRGRKFDRVVKALDAGLITVDEARDEIGYSPMEEDDRQEAAEQAARDAYGRATNEPAPKEPPDDETEA
jgi:HK97 family phage portal protein